MTEYYWIIGHKFTEVESYLRSFCRRMKWELAIHDPDSPGNIDVEPKRLNVYVDVDFIITKLTRG